MYIITNADGAENYKVVRAPVDAPQQSNWVEVVPPSGSRKIEDMDMFKVRGCGLRVPLCCAPVSPPRVLGSMTATAPTKFGVQFLLCSLCVIADCFALWIRAWPGVLDF